MKKFPARFRRALTVGAICASLAAGAGGEPPAASSPKEVPARSPVPYTARYSVKRSGATVAEVVYTLARSPQGWEYRARAKPSKMVSFIISTEIDEYSLLEIAGSSVRPLSYRYEQTGGKKEERILRADYDWQANAVAVTDGTEDRRLSLAATAQDPLSVQLAVIQCMKSDCAHMDFLVLDDLELEKRRFERGDGESLRTALGDHETIKVSHRSGKRQTVMWLAPELNHIPVMVRQYRNDELKSEMRITAVDFE